MQSSAELSPAEYNEVVYYCPTCHSLHILVDEGLADENWDGSYCGKCFSPHVEKCKFGDWLKEEERREEERRKREWNK